jgi:hypothetical protein
VQRAAAMTEETNLYTASRTLKCRNRKHLNNNKHGKLLNSVIGTQYN